jgi:hypothetical protein
MLRAWDASYSVILLALILRSERSERLEGWGAASRFETAAFGGLLSMRPVEQHEAERILSQ